MTDSCESSEASSVLDFMKNHIKRYIETDGEDGHIMNGAPCLILTTVGKNSGQSRQVAVIYGTHTSQPNGASGDVNVSRTSYVVVASKGGADQSPAWFHNLMADPRPAIQVKAEKFSVKPRIATGSERRELWNKMSAIFPDYIQYQKNTAREIPVVILDPIQ
jgi:deazaflavin-dependent oxidoreductase (nitroreductase family)